MSEASLQSLADLLSGKTLQDIKDEFDRLEECRVAAERVVDTLTSSNEKVVRRALRSILSKKSATKKLPLLKTLMHSERPHHSQTPLLVAAIKARVPVWLYGETGSGKTTAASMVAEQLGLPFRLISVCPMTTKSEFFGYRDAGGTYHGTAFREVYEHGGVFLIDEVDNGNASILAVLNAALANNTCPFPDGNIPRHEDAVFLAAANTIGQGADITYIGRNALDATTLDRFVFIKMDIDPCLEKVISGGVWDSSNLVDIARGGEYTVDEWYELVKDVRELCREMGLRHIISPRATLYGGRLIAAGVGRHYLEHMCLWKGLRKTDRKKIKKNLGFSGND
jgi:midasin (ATPase involved in ribosome maturation)